MRSSEKPTPLNPPLSGGKYYTRPQGNCESISLSPLVRGGETRTLSRGAGGGNYSSPDKGRAGGVKGFIPYNKKLTALARENRKNPTTAERKMWNEVLRMCHCLNYKFSRQKPIADFIVDFYCAELRLAIEIDGDSHSETVEYDALRTGVLNANGITVIRYTNDEILNNLEGVYDELLARIEQIRMRVAAR